jgi:hypothetical protein
MAMKHAILGLAAILFLAAAPAFADDYLELCKGTEGGNPNADKLCACTAGKIKPEDRAATLKALQAMGDAMNGGKPADPNNPEFAKGSAAQMEAENQCEE